MAANIPCTALSGKKSISDPILASPKTIWIKPAIKMAPKAKCQPKTESPPPNSATEPAIMTINPAAGPLIVSGDPAKMETTIPPIMAVIKPIIAGKSLIFWQ